MASPSLRVGDVGWLRSARLAAAPLTMRGLCRDAAAPADGASRLFGLHPDPNPRLRARIVLWREGHMVPDGRVIEPDVPPGIDAERRERLAGVGPVQEIVAARSLLRAGEVERKNEVRDRHAIDLVCLGLYGVTH